jgi:galactitol-specific phosphotransferase system IIB component
MLKSKKIPQQLQNILKQKNVTYKENIKKQQNQSCFSISSDIVCSGYRLQVNLNYIDEDGAVICDAIISIDGIKTEIVKAIAIGLIKTEFVNCRKYDQKYLKHDM